MTHEQKWWHRSVVYQIYPRSFYDADGDGIGDLRGIIHKLDYLALLGVEVLWLCPVYASPNDDNGYDIADYYRIMDEFGTMDDMDELIAEAGRRGLKIMMDIVANHTSDEHRWFCEARKSPDNSFHDYYVWTKQPNGLMSVFGGSAWQYEENLGEYYLHLFSRKQPDLNWSNPQVRREIVDVLAYWLEKGVGGFRFDVIDLIGKIPEQRITANGPRLHDYVLELNEDGFGQYDDILTVGEAWGATPETGVRWSDPDRHQLSMIFQFGHLTLDQARAEGEKWDIIPYDLRELKTVLSRWQTELYGRGWNSLFWNNHDLPRVVSRFGDEGEYRVESAKMLATVLHGMSGTPYIYQGEEIGMTNVRFADIDDYRDIETRNMYRERLAAGYRLHGVMAAIYAKGRDNARTPMQWDTSEHAGFSLGTPWIKVNPNYWDINVLSAVEDKDSVFHYYRRLVALRKTADWLVYGSYQLLLPEHGQLFAYCRRYELDEYLVFGNFSDRTLTVDPAALRLSPRADVLLNNYPDPTVLEHGAIRPWEAAIVKL
ncbi:glycoside hydrolase family 13 protein [Acerihabitans arboris]|uniref:Alpha,alpha-phosphotrehalase n=1 Tax=Acerihabitans arboris TaxID=2691583 RepID=A0A845SMG7_9GAMM|nr:alpha-glucosidase [Acerihabitans arboris]NDL63811.1 alpha,alpha-phosphotrehalase [Acerihabitans arboris]